MLSMVSVVKGTQNTRAACICQNFEVVSCQNNGSCHLSEWTFVELSLVRMDFCRIVTCQNGPL